MYLVEENKVLKYFEARLFDAREGILLKIGF